jgi:hypothetical protein
MTTNQMTVAGALLLAFIGGCMYGKSSGGESEVSSTEETGSDEAATGGGRPVGSDADGGTRSGGGAASRNQRLVGNWRYTETYVSDGYSFVSDQFLTISADGTMEIRNGGAAGGGGGFTWEQTADDQAVTCEWRTQGNIIEVRGDGRDWTPMAEYEISGNTLMTTSQGERQLWERI